jgi:hypothetical protein
MQKGFSSIALLVFAIIILGIGASIFHQSKNQTESNKIPATSTPFSTILENTTIQNDNNYKSEKLGVSFKYPTGFGVKEAGNRIYVFGEKSKPEDGQYVEVFAKDKEKDLKQTIEQQLLVGKPNYCHVKIENNQTLKSLGYITAIIEYPVNPGEDLETLDKKTIECGKDYSMTNGRRYFAYDPQHPSQFGFVSIGQYSIGFGKPPYSTTWEETIKFLK